jgi:very-short-patch-repair endonuclease
LKGIDEELNTNSEVQMDEELSQAFEAWMEKHRRSSKGERKRRLLRTSNHAEKLFIKQVWWPAFGQFTGLNPEFEVRDYKDGWRYLDFAFITEGFRLCIEIDSYGTHWRDVNRYQFADHLMRQNHLVIDGWLVLRFSYDDILEKPRVCQQILQQLMGRWSVMRTTQYQSLSPAEQVIMRLAASLTKPITPLFAATELGLHRTTIMRHFQSLVKKGLLIPFRTDVKRICSYRINKTQLPKEIS